MKSLSIEFHHDADQWFVSRVVNHKYINPDEEADEVRRDELCGHWDANCSNSEIVDYLFEAVVYELGSPTITLRGVRFRAVGYIDFCCGYDLTRIHLEAIEPVVFDSCESSIRASKIPQTEKSQPN